MSYTLPHSLTRTQLHFLYFLYMNQPYFSNLT